MNRKKYFIYLLFMALPVVGSCFKVWAQPPSGREGWEATTEDDEDNIPAFTKDALRLVREMARTIVLPQTVEVTPTESQEQWFRFMATQTGYVEVSNCEKKQAACDITILNAGLHVHDTEDQCDAIFRHRLLFPVEKDKLYYIRCRPYDENADYAFSVSEKADAAGLLCRTAIPIEAGTRQAVDHSDYTVAWYAFSPSESGVYSLEYNNYEKGNVTVFAGNCKNWDILELNNSDFYATAGKTYLIRRSKGETTNYNWTLQKQDDPGNRFCQTAAAIGAQAGIDADFSRSEVIWYRFTPEKTAYYEINAGADLDIRIFKGPNCDNAEWVPRHDDPRPQRDSGGRFAGEAGRPHFIRFEAKKGSSFQWALRESEYRDNCTCTMATPVQAGQDTIVADHSNCETLFYSFIPQETAHYRARFCDLQPDADFSFELRSGHCNHPQMEESSRINNGSDCLDTEFYAAAGSKYTLLIQHKGNYRWSLENIGMPEGRTCASAGEAGLNEPQSFDKSWFTFTPSETAIYQAKACGLQDNEYFFFTFAEGECGNLHYNYNYDLENTRENDCMTYEFLLSAGERRYIRARTGNYASEANWTLSCLGLPEGRACITAATAGLDEELAFTNEWYRFTPAKNAVYEIRLSSPNESGLDTYIIVYTGTCDDLHWLSLGRLDDERLVYFSGKADDTYYLELGYDKDESEDYMWEIALSSTSANVICANADEIQAGDVITSSHTQSDVLWYRFTASDSGIYRVKLGEYGEDIWSKCNILSNTCDNPVLIAEDGDYFYAEAGQAYYVAMLNYDEDDEDNPYTWKLTKEEVDDHRLCRNAIPIQPGESLQAKILESETYHYYLFTPDAGGTYEIECDEPIIIALYSGTCEKKSEIAFFHRTFLDPGFFVAEAGKKYLFAILAEEGDYRWSLLRKPDDISLGSASRDAADLPQPH